MTVNLTDEYSVKLITKLEGLNAKSKKPLDMNIVKKAMLFAKEYHGEQKRDSGEPYYSHPVAVSEMVAEHYLKTDMIVASLLHDVVEDTEATIELVALEFGYRVAEMVEGLTRVKSYGKITSAEVLRLLYECDDKETSVIKIFDRIHNMETIKNKPPEKQRKIIKETAEAFISSSIYLENAAIEKFLLNTIFENTQINEHPLQVNVNQYKMILDELQPFSLAFQNEIIPTKRQSKLEQ